MLMILEDKPVILCSEDSTSCSRILCFEAGGEHLLCPTSVHLSTNSVCLICSAIFLYQYILMVNVRLYVVCDPKVYVV